MGLTNHFLTAISCSRTILEVLFRIIYLLVASLFILFCDYFVMGWSFEWFLSNFDCIISSDFSFEDSLLREDYERYKHLYSVSDSWRVIFYSFNFSLYGLELNLSYVSPAYILLFCLFFCSLSWFFSNGIFGRERFQSVLIFLIYCIYLFGKVTFLTINFIIEELGMEYFDSELIQVLL